MDQDAELPFYVADALAGYLALGEHLAVVRAERGDVPRLPFAGETAQEVAAAHAQSDSPLPLYDAVHQAVREALAALTPRSAGPRPWWKFWAAPVAAEPLVSRGTFLQRTAPSERRRQFDAALARLAGALPGTPDPVALLMPFLRRNGWVEDGAAIAAVFAADPRSGLLLYDRVRAGDPCSGLAPWVLAAAIELFHQARDFTSVLAAVDLYLVGEPGADRHSLRILDRGWFAALRLGERGRTLALLEAWLERAPGDQRALQCRAVTLSAEPEIALRYLAQAGVERGDAPEAATVLYAELAGRIGRTGAARAALDAAAGFSPDTPERLFARHNLEVRGEQPETSAAAAFRAEGLDLGWTRLAVGEVEDRTPPPAAASDVLVSVVVTAYQAEAYLETAVASILDQSHRAIELFIVDDASTDRTARIARRIAGADSRVRYLRNDRNRGTYVSKNRALRRARGAYAALCDADDMWLRHHLAAHLAVMEADPAVMVTTSDWLRLTEEGLIECGIGGRHIGLCPHSTMFRRTAFAQIGYFDSVRFGADAEMLHRARLHFGRDGVRHIPRILSLGRRHGASLTTSGASRAGPLAETPLRRDYARDWNAWHFGELRAGRLPVTQGTEQDRPFAVAQEMRA